MMLLTVGKYFMYGCWMLEDCHTTNLVGAVEGAY